MVSFNMEFPEVDNAAVVFGCMGYVGSLPPPPYQAFNRRCSRDDADLDSKFVCYEMANGTNFQPFVEEAERILIDPCDPEGMPSIPSFIYQVILIVWSYSHVSNASELNFSIYHEPSTIRFVRCFNQIHILRLPSAERIKLQEEDSLHRWMEEMRQLISMKL